MSDDSPDTQDRAGPPVVRRLLRLSWEYRARSLIVIGCQALLLVLTLSGLGLAGLSVDVVRFALDPAAPAPRFPWGFAPAPETTPLEVVVWLSLGVVVAALVRSWLNYVYGVEVGRLVHEQIVPTLRLRLFHKLQRLSFRFFDGHSTGGIINRVTRDVQLLRSFVDGVVIQGIVLCLALGVFLAYLLATHVQLTLVCLALTPLLFLATRRFSRWAEPAYRENRVLSDRMVRALTEGIEGILVTKVFGKEQQQFDRFQHANVAVMNQQQSIFRAVSCFSPGIDFLTQVNLVVLLGYGGFLVSARELSLGELIVFAGLLQQFATRASAMSGVVNTLQQSLSGARRVFEVLDAPFGVDSPVPPRPIPKDFSRIEFDDVCFEYAPGKKALENVRFTVERGETLGVLGVTGAGKSTLLSLIPRFYDPTSGAVRLDGIPLSEFDVGELRSHVGIVFQESLLFRDTVANNIAFGRPDATREQVEAAARVAGAHQFIQRLPKGYDSVLDENGVNLSGGQRQRIAIARAILPDPELLVLDDPTTAVDPETEREVLRAIRNATRGRTTLIVSNRVSSLRDATRIIVLQNGRVTQRGTHEELMGRPGLYRTAAQTQGIDEESLELLRRTEASA